MNTFKLRLTLIKMNELIPSATSAENFRGQNDVFGQMDTSTKSYHGGLEERFALKNPRHRLVTTPSRPEFRRVKSHVIKFDHTVTEISMWTLKWSLLCLGQRFFGDFYIHLNLISPATEMFFRVTKSHFLVCQNTEKKSNMQKSLRAKVNKIIFLYC